MEELMIFADSRQPQEKIKWILAALNKRINGLASFALNLLKQKKKAFVSFVKAFVQLS